VAVFFNVCLIRLLFITYVVSVGNIFFTSILSETPSPTAVLFEFTVRMSFVAVEVCNIPNFQSATSEQVKINIRHRLLRFYRRRRRCRHAIVGHRKRQRYKDYHFFSYLRGLLKARDLPDWGTYPSFEPPNPSFDPMSSVPAEEFSRLMDDPNISEFLFTDLFRLLPIQNDVSLVQACVALTSDLHITAANATCGRHQAVLFV